MDGFPIELTRHWPNKINVWISSWLQPVVEVPFLHQLIGAKSATHRVFSDSEEKARLGVMDGWMGL